MTGNVNATIDTHSWASWLPANIEKVRWWGGGGVSAVLVSGCWLMTIYMCRYKFENDENVFFLSR